MFKFVAILMLSASFSLQAITIGAYNIRNFDYDERSRVHTNKPELATILSGLKADVLSLEEINNTVEFERFVASSLKDYAVALSKCGGAHGQRLGFLYNTATIELINFHEDLRVTEPGTPGACDAGTRPLAIALFQIKATKQKFYGITAHLKAGSAPAAMSKRKKQYDVIKLVINELKEKSGVKEYYFAGDLNTTEYLSKGADYVLLNKLIKDLGMVHLTQNLSCSAYWWGGTDDGIESPSLLDHIVITPGLLKTPGKLNVNVGGH